MSTTREEVIVRMGIDSSEIKAGLHGVKHMFKDLASELLGPGLTIAAVVAEFEHLSEKVTQLNRSSEELGVTVEFFQQMAILGEKAGVGAETIERAMGKMLQKLPAGADLEEEIMKLSDQLAAMPDPAERARLAVQSFGKSGIQLIPILSEGSGSIKKLADNFSVLSEEETTAIERSKQYFESLGRIKDSLFSKWLTGASLIGKGWWETVKNMAGGEGYTQSLVTGFAKMFDEETDAIQDQIRLKRELAAESKIIVDYEKEAADQDERAAENLRKLVRLKKEDEQAKKEALNKALSAPASQRVKDFLLLQEKLQHPMLYGDRVVYQGMADKLFTGMTFSEKAAIRDASDASAAASAISLKQILELLSSGKLKIELPEG